jgi:hypothetical protein
VNKWALCRVHLTPYVFFLLCTHDVGLYDVGKGSFGMGSDS